MQEKLEIWLNSVKLYIEKEARNKGEQFRLNDGLYIDIEVLTTKFSSFFAMEEASYAVKFFYYFGHRCTAKSAYDTRFILASFILAQNKPGCQVLCADWSIQQIE